MGSRSTVTEPLRKTRTNNSGLVTNSVGDHSMNGKTGPSTLHHGGPAVFHHGAARGIQSLIEVVQEPPAVGAGFCTWKSTGNRNGMEYIFTGIMFVWLVDVG